MKRKTLHLSALLAPALFVSSASAAVVAFTDFDGRTAAGLTASNLNWTLSGVDDPGSMTAVGAPALFDNTAVVQNAFVPGINTGNGNTFWTTSVALTVTAGSAVTLTDVEFGYWAVNGGQAQNVDRRSDFTITLSDPSSGLVETVTVADIVNGTNTSNGVATPVTLTFLTPRALSAPGTYTLEIKGGDFAGADETGNHTGIDDLRINGDVTVVPEPSAFALSALGLLVFLGRRRRS